MLPHGHGLNNGRQVTKNVSQSKHSHLCGHLTKYTEFVRDVVREVCGFAPLKWHTAELPKISKDRRALKSIKKRVGDPHPCQEEEGGADLAAMKKAAAKKN